MACIVVSYLCCLGLLATAWIRLWNVSCILSSFCWWIWRDRKHKNIEQHWSCQIFLEALTASLLSLSLPVYTIYIFFIYCWEMLTNALRALASNLFKDSFYEKRKEKLMFWYIFFISHKSGIKTFLK